MKRFIARTGRRVRGELRRLKGPTVALPSRIVSTAECARSEGVRWHPAYPRCATDVAPPMRHGARAADFTAKLDPEIPELGVLEMERGTLLGPHGWVVAPDGRLVADLTWYGTHRDEMVLDPGRVRVRRLEGTCVSLTSDWSWENHAHFLLDGICRLGLVEKAGFRIEEADHVYCGVPNRNAEDIARRLGIPAGKIVKPLTGLAVQAGRLLAPSFPGLRRNYPAWTVALLRRALTPSRAAPWRRLYIPRTTSRKLTNIAALMPLLEAHGFEVFDPGGRLDTPERFDEAAVVVGPHGAGLANIAFCRPGARVLELVPSDFVWPYWWSLSAAAGLEYGYLVGTADAERAPAGRRTPGPSDFAVDESEMKAALAHVCR